MPVGVVGRLWVDRGVQFLLLMLMQLQSCLVAATKAEHMLSVHASHDLSPDWYRSFQNPECRDMFMPSPFYLHTYCQCWQCKWHP